MITQDYINDLNTVSERHGLNELWRQLPVLGICGSSGAGKTTLIEALIPEFLDRGFRVAVIKHDARNVRVDQAGKDSDRLYRAGADVWVTGDEMFGRRHRQTDLKMLLVDLCSSYDLILVEGHGDTPVPKIWLLGTVHREPPPGTDDIVNVLSREQADAHIVLDWIMDWIERRWRAVPVWGCVLIGGKSRRMGRPKHLIERGGRTWIELAVAQLEPQVEQVVIAGGGDLPPALGHVSRLPDIPGLAGPLSGVLSVLRWHPYVSWLVTACDQPDIRPEALEWLLDSRHPGVWATLPDLGEGGRIEPLLAHYDFRCRDYIEAIAASGQLRLSLIAGRHGIMTPRPPSHLHGSWRNMNTPEDTLPHNR